MSFSSLQAVGVKGVDEVMELELDQMVTTWELVDAHAAHALPGLCVTTVEWLPPDEPEAHVSRGALEIPVPANRRSDLERRIAVELES